MSIQILDNIIASGSMLRAKRSCIIRRLFFFLVPVMVASCSSLKSVPVQIAIPPPESIPDNIQSLTLINRATDYRFRNHRSDSLQQRFYQRQFSLDTLILDTQVCDTLLFALGDMLFESGRFDIVIPEQRFLAKGSPSYYPVAMSWEEADSLTATFSTDAVLSLDYLRTRVITLYDKEVQYDPYRNDFYNAYFAQMRVAYESLFRVYYPAEKQVIRSISVVDTLYWEDADTEIRPLFNRMTTVKGALIESGIHMALGLTGKIAPEWRNTRRYYYFKGHALLEQAHSHVLKGEWPEAGDIWKQLAQGTVSKSLKSKAEFNIALYHEMMGDIDEAVSWGLKSYESRYRPVTYEYLERLYQRKQQISRP